MSATANISKGLSSVQEIVITREMTVAHFEPNMPEVYGTPIMIYHMEVTAGRLIQSHLPDGWISVGVLVSVKHLAATPVGAVVTIKAEVMAVDDDAVTFMVEAHDGLEKIGEGTHIRAPVQLSRFLKRVEAKSGQVRENSASEAKSSDK